MKKALALLIAAILATATVWAASTASYDEMKTIKQAQRAEREAQKASGTVKPDSKWTQFWKNEGERSGLGSTGSGTGTFFKKLNPAPFFKTQEDQYKARKAAAGK